MQESELVEIKEKESEFQATLAAIKSFELTTEDDFRESGEFLKEVKRLAKSVDARLKEIVTPWETVIAPYEAKIKAATALFKPHKLLLKQMEAALKEKVVSFTTAQRIQKLEAARAVAEAAQAGDYMAVHTAAKHLVDEVRVKGITVSDRWDYKAVDFSIVPDDFKCLDHSALKIHIKASGENDPEPIPGIEFIRTGSATVRS